MNSNNLNTKKRDPKRSPLKMIRKHCIDCSGGNKQEVKLCPVETCPLWEFRFGYSPYRVGTRKDVSVRQTGTVS